MPLVVDAHLHMYPCYDTAKALSVLVRALRSYDTDAELAAVLAERSDCHFFADLKEGRVGEERLGGRVEVLDGAVRVIHAEGVITIFPGRQVVTAERVEVMALTVDEAPADGVPAVDALAAIRETGGLPAVGWAPGKWMFGRKHVVAGLIRSASPGELLLGDTSLRPTMWAEPLLMREGRQKGLGVAAGSDPLPAVGEERFMGRYATRLEGTLVGEQPVVALRKALRSSGQSVGSRCGPIEVFRRLRRYGRERGPSAPVHR